VQDAIEEKELAGQQERCSKFMGIFGSRPFLASETTVTLLPPARCMQLAFSCTDLPPPSQNRVVLPMRGRWWDGCPLTKSPLCCPMVCPVGYPALFVLLIIYVRTLPGSLHRASPARLLLLQYSPLAVQVADSIYRFTGHLISLMWLE